jgi:hypothetical protein
VEYDFINCTIESKSLLLTTAFKVNSVNREHMNFTTKEELDIWDRQKHGKWSQFVLEICVPKKKLKTVKISDKESFYIHDTCILVVLKQEHDKDTVRYRYSHVIHLHQWSWTKSVRCTSYTAKHRYLHVRYIYISGSEPRA